MVTISDKTASASAPASPNELNENNPICSLSDEMILEIFGHLGAVDLARAGMTCRHLNVVANDPSLTPIANGMKFGREAYLEYYGVDVGKEPPISLELEAFLNSPCPLNPGSGKKVRDTHLLTLIPATVKQVASDGKEIEKPFSLDLLGDLIQKAKEGSATKYSDCRKLKEEDKVKSPEKSYWILMSRDVLPNSRNRTYQDQVELVNGVGKGYALPTMQEIATSILMEHVQSGTRLYADSPVTFTRCQELSTFGLHMVVGGLSSSGLIIYNSIDGNRYDFLGAGARRKFSD